MQYQIHRYLIGQVGKIVEKQVSGPDNRQAPGIEWHGMVNCQVAARALFTYTRASGMYDRITGERAPDFTKTLREMVEDVAL